MNRYSLQFLLTFTSILFILVVLFMADKALADSPFVVPPNKTISECSEPPPGTWGLTSDNNIEFCFVIRDRKVCSELPKQQMLELLTGKQKSKKLNI